jgi:Icc-related predicted phosphoesterase
MEKKSIKVVAMSDLHGRLPPSKSIPKCDLLLIGGDICGHHGILDQSLWLHKEFKPWLTNLPAEKVIGVAGNHDFIWEKSPHMVPNLPWEYLQDDYCDFKGWKIYGSPWQLRFYDWAFNLDEPDLERKWSHIPDDVDILVLHGPPLGFGDLVTRQEHVGSPSLTEKIREIKPKLAIFGHIHPGFGVYQCGGSTLANVALVNDKYIWTNEPTVFFLDPESKKTTSTHGLLNEKKVETIIDWNA